MELKKIYLSEQEKEAGLALIEILIDYSIQYMPYQKNHPAWALPDDFNAKYEYWKKEIKAGLPVEMVGDVYDGLFLICFEIQFMKLELQRIKTAVTLYFKMKLKPEPVYYEPKPKMEISLVGKLTPSRTFEQEKLEF